MAASAALRDAARGTVLAPRKPELPPMRFLVLLFPALWLTMAAAQPAPLRLVSTAWPPFTNPPRQPRFALDLVEDALRRSNLTAKTTIVSAAQFTPSLLSGLFDGSAAAWKDPERERGLIFSQPYLENRLVLVGRRGADVSAKALSDLTGKRIAIVEGYWYGDAIGGPGPVVGAIAQRGRQPHPAAQGRGGLHADGSARRPVHRDQLSEGIRRRDCRSARRRSSRGSCTSRSDGRMRTRCRSSSASTRRSAA